MQYDLFFILLLIAGLCLIVLLLSKSRRKPGAVICDTSPIIYLSMVGAIDLLRQMYHTIKIPDGVYDELTFNQSAPGAFEVQTLRWIHRRSVRNHRAVDNLILEHPKTVDRGEAEAMVLAVEMRARVLIIDDFRPRKVAEEDLGLTTIGLLGVLRDAKVAGIISEVRPLTDAMIAGGFFISKSLYQQYLIDLGEM